MDKNSVLFALDFQAPFIQIDHNLVVPQNLMRTICIRWPCSIPGIAVITSFDRSTGTSQAHEDSGGFNVRVQGLVLELFQQRVAPFYSTLTTTTDQKTSLLAGSDRRVLGMRYRASHRLRHHRNPRPLGTVARSWTPD